MSLFASLAPRPFIETSDPLELNSNVTKKTCPSLGTWRHPCTWNPKRPVIDKLLDMNNCTNHPMHPLGPLFNGASIPSETLPADSQIPKLSEQVFHLRTNEHMPIVVLGTPFCQRFCWEALGIWGNGNFNHGNKESKHRKPETEGQVRGVKCIPMAHGVMHSWR